MSASVMTKTSVSAKKSTLFVDEDAFHSARVAALPRPDLPVNLVPLPRGCYPTADVFEVLFPSQSGFPRFLAVQRGRDEERVQLERS